MKITKPNSLYLLAITLLSLAPVVNSQGLRANALDIDYNSIPSCFEGFSIPSDEPPPRTWCMLNLSFRVFLHCMEQNIESRMVEPGFMQHAEKEFVMECLHLCYIDPEKEPRASLLGQVNDSVHQLVGGVADRFLKMI